MTGILIIHGFAGTRHEVKPLYDSLAEKGYIVSMPCLSGHELSLKKLAISKRHEWIKSAEEAYLELSEKCDNIIVIGFSMGGLIAVQLYKKHKFSNLITINTPIYYWDIKRIVKNMFSDFKTYSKKYFTVSTNKPIRSLLQFQRLLSETKPFFKDIDCNCLVIQTQDDDTVHAKSAEYIYKHISGDKSIFKPSLGGHFVFISDNKTEVIEKIEIFIKNESCQ